MPTRPRNSASAPITSGRHAKGSKDAAGVSALAQLRGQIQALQQAGAPNRTRQPLSSKSHAARQGSSPPPKHATDALVLNHAPDLELDSDAQAQPLEPMFGEMSDHLASDSQPADTSEASLFGHAADARPRKRRRPEPTAKQRALGLLTRREHSRKELTRKLTVRGVEREDANEAIAQLTEAGWQDDNRFAESLVRSRAFSGHGPIRIRAELGTHGLSREQIQTALDSFEGDFTEIARDLVRRRHGHVLADDRTAQRKAAELLVRRGYTYDQIRAATRYDPDDEAW